MKSRRILTGMRPTNNLTLGNYAGGILPLLDMQKKYSNSEIYLFVATLHGITDNEPGDIKENTFNVVRDYLACGVDPSVVNIYDQLDLRKEISLITLYLQRHTTASRLLRLPTLKDKLKGEQSPEQANVLLMNYPIMMAADIICQEATDVPVGKDQYPHIELTRELVDTFNRKYGSVLIKPQVLNADAEDVGINILSIRGEGKMSKSNPDGAIFLNDTPASIAKKIKRATTALPGETSSQLLNLSVLGKLTGRNTGQLDSLYKEHMSGKQVMGEYKKMLAKSIVDFLEPIQERQREISQEYVHYVLETGATVASENAKKVLQNMEKCMGL